MNPFFPFKASDLLKNDKELKFLRLKNYKTELSKCLDVIYTANLHAHSQFTTFNVPSSLPGDPNFIQQECLEFLKIELSKLDFYVKTLKPGDSLLISWMENHIEHVKKKNRKKALEIERQTEKTIFLSNADKQHPYQHQHQHQDQYHQHQHQHQHQDQYHQHHRQNQHQSDTKNIILNYNPDSALSNLHFTTSLIKENPKYSHLKSVQKSRKKY